MTTKSRELPFRSTDKMSACVFTAEMHEHDMAQAMGKAIELYFPVKAADVKVWQNYYHGWEVWITDATVPMSKINKMVTFGQAFKLGWWAHRAQALAARPLFK